MIRTIIIDDEASAINVLGMLIKKKCKDDVEVLATTTSPSEGRALIEQHKPDLVFLDIEMPGMTGIDLIRSLPNPNFHIVFVTAYDAYAVEAFELSAIDYLLKPIGADKVERVINKIKESRRKNQLLISEQLQQLERILKMQPNANENKIGVGMADRIVFVNIPDILFCEAQGNYTNVILFDGKKIVASKTLGDFENQFAGKNFFRIHHSYLINMSRVKEFQRYEGGYVMMENNIKHEVSQRKRKDFLDAISNFVI